MAFAPCTVHSGGFKGGASTFFPALVKGTERFSTRHKTCPDCGLAFLEWADKHLQLVSQGDHFFDVVKQLACSNCGGHLDDPYGMFLNTYVRGEEERQYYGQLCSPCAPTVAEHWGIAW
jgi:ribosomal protein S27AE